MKTLLFKTRMHAYDLQCVLDQIRSSEPSEHKYLSTDYLSLPFFLFSLSGEETQFHIDQRSRDA
jgi:hypothetical protein